MTSRLNIVMIALTIAEAAWCGTDPMASPVEIVCQGMCDASAVVALGQHFLVADDEDNILRVYSRQRGGLPVSTFDLSSFLAVDPKSPEVDLEGAAPVGDRVYWISSHARNKNGRERESRQRFFATTLMSSNGAVVIRPIGVPYRHLLDDLIREPRLQPFQLAAASRRAPKTRNALNIEGLCATPDGHLLIGFRNPIPSGRALVVVLLNPGELIEGKRARFGEMHLLDLGGLGIRSITRAGPRYFIIAGSYSGEDRSQLYEWHGGTDSPRKIPSGQLAGLNPEAAEYLSENGIERLMIVSDDGTLKIGGKACKELTDSSQKRFRAGTIDL